MKIKNTIFKTTLILGAGATRGAIGKVSFFTSKSFTRIPPPLNSDYFYLLKSFIKTKEGRKYQPHLNKLEDFIKKEMAYPKEKVPSMEEVFNWLFLSKDLPHIIKKSGPGRMRKKGFRKEIRYFLYLLVIFFKYLQEKSSKNYYYEIIKVLTPGDRIITLNYDTFLDKCLFENGWKIEKGYGFKIRNKIKKPKGWAPNQNLENVLLLKPHGSFNWYAKGEKSELIKVLSRRKPSEVREPTKIREYDIQKARLIRFFIPPLYYKFFENKFWATLWHQAYESIKSCERLIIIGCSIIPTDYHLRVILSKAIKERKEKFKEIIIVNKSKEIIKKWKQLLRKSSKRGFRKFTTFSKFIKYIKG